MTKDFLKYRYVYIIISLIVIVGGIVYGVCTGYKFDIDFKSGTKIQVDLQEEFDVKEVESIVKEVTGKNVLVQKMSSGNSTVQITTEILDDAVVTDIVNELGKRYINMEEASTRNIQPSYGRELLESAVLAVVISVILILLYIGIRFKVLGFTAAITAILALIHDVLFIVAIYGIIKFPINSSFVAVILTVVGYSINDTIVIYDRIRENRRKVTRSKDIKDTINLSISQNISRTVNTSVTTVVAILSVFILAYLNNQQTLMEFSLPLVIGVIVGTYSSICISTSLWYMLDNFVMKLKKK